MPPIILECKPRRPKRPVFTVVDLTTKPETPSCHDVGADLESKFPDEMWEEVFKRIEKRSTLLCVILTSKRFRNIGRRLLYKSLHYRKPHDFLDNRTFWDDPGVSRSWVKEMMVTGTQHESYAELNGRELVELQVQLKGALPPLIEETVRRAKANKARRWELVHTTPLVDHILHFTDLVSLTFSGLSLPLEIHYTIRLLRNLTQLSFIDTQLTCWSFDELDEEADRHANVLALPLPPLVELTLWEHEWSTIMLDFVPSRAHPTIPSRCLSILQLMFAPTLRVLRIDWNPTVAAIITKGAQTPVPNVKSLYTDQTINPFISHLPNHLRHLQIRYVQTHGNRTVGGAWIFEEQHRTMRRAQFKVLAEFIRMCTHLEGLGFAGSDCTGVSDVNIGFQTGFDTNGPGLTNPNDLSLGLIPLLDINTVPVQQPPSFSTRIPHSSWSHLLSYSGPAAFLPLLAGSTSSIQALELICFEHSFSSISYGTGRISTPFRDDPTEDGTPHQIHPQSWSKIDGFISSFCDKGLEFPSLKSLSLTFSGLWKGTKSDLLEIVGSISLIARSGRIGKDNSLEELKIRWIAGDGISDDNLLSLGAQVLSRFPHLKVVHLYRPKLLDIPGLSEDYYSLSQDPNSPFTTKRDSYTCSCSRSCPSPCPSAMSTSTSSWDGSGSEGEEDCTIDDCEPFLHRQRGYIAAWRMFCPQLREVKLMSGLVWRKIDTCSSLMWPSIPSTAPVGDEPLREYWAVSSIERTDWEYEASWVMNGNLGLDVSPGSSATSASGTSSDSEELGKLRGEGDMIMRMKLEDWRRKREHNSWLSLEQSQRLGVSMLGVMGT
ncbi:hypothetical protein D9758_008793 [Tetrapyrgos nigripes]|uniref:F-box domain-containing protein n=1 Tax=Tetrapyrgos nigripes TaxID=182062 RepID=A0A8H5FXQ6_9AGAR|nr:hypothetical protein D9758_008793 [Tetrapyrgos nigripes]